MECPLDSLTRGVSDIIIGVIPPSGRFLAIEVKRPGGKPLAEQQQLLDTISEAGGLAFVACSVDDVIHAFELDQVRRHP